MSRLKRGQKKRGKGKGSVTTEQPPVREYIVKVRFTTVSLRYVRATSKKHAKTLWEDSVHIDSSTCRKSDVGEYDSLDVWEKEDFIAVEKAKGYSSKGRRSRG